MVEARGIEEREKREDREREQRGIEKETKRQFEEKEGLRDPPLLEFLDPTPSCSHCFFKSKLELKYKKLFLQAYRKHYLKNMSWCETECKKMCHW